MRSPTIDHYFAAVMFAFAATSAAAQDAPLERARTLIETELQFSAGIDLLEAALSARTIRAEDRARAQYLLAIAYVARGEPARASAAFEEMLALDPELEPDALSSPKVHAAFHTAQQASRAWQPKVMRFSATKSGELWSIELELADPKMIAASIEIAAGSEVQKVAASPGTIRAELAFMVHADRPLVLIATAKNELGCAVARAETIAVAPLPPIARTADPAPPAIAADPAWYGSWWVWAGVIGIAALATATTVALTHSERDDGVPTIHLP